MMDTHELAMLPIAFLLDRAEPFERLCSKSTDLHAGYRDVVNNGIWGYQLHVYMTMIEDRFGGETRRAVRAQQVTRCWTLTRTMARPCSGPSP